MTAASSQSLKDTQKVCLVVIDGWGISKTADKNGDAIRNAKTPCMDMLVREFPNTSIHAHGLHVGLTRGLMGNSEVGHLNIGAGRVVFQEITRIDTAIEKKRLLKINVLKDSLQKAKETGSVHFLGLVSDGGVHSHIKHLFALIEAAKEAGVPKAFIHFVADGRDTDPKHAVKYLQQLLDFIQKLNYGTLATIVGRYYSMDRDKRWERIKIAYDAYTAGVGEKTTTPLKLIEAKYASGETDEFLKPIIVDSNGLFKANDTIICFNFRSDRMRQIVESLVFKQNFQADVILKNLNIVCMAQYNPEWTLPIIFPPHSMANTLPEYLSKNNLKQFHCAETEKYAHVTFFFNGGVEKVNPGEDRELVQSPKIATYDLQPEMSSKGVADKVCDKLKSQQHHFVMLNFAPPDMVGHTGVYAATIKAVEATDRAIAQVYNACKDNGYILLITSDHGNAEKKFNERGEPHTAHTTAPVPFIVCSKKYKFTDLKEIGENDEDADEEKVPIEEWKKRPGALCDVAPCILKLMGLSLPKEMTGRILITEA